MSEGELKARITELFHSESLAVSAGEEEIEIQEGCIFCESEAKADVFSVLDEAKQEYLGLTDECLKEYPNGAGYWHGDILAIAREDWFKKWFGEVFK
jgi:hypothetical protein